jgi:transposase-like protein
MDKMNFSSNHKSRQLLQLAKSSLLTMRMQLKERLREVALTLATDLMQEELLELCGPKYSRKEIDQAIRSGSDPGSIYLSGQRVKVRRPRAKDKNGREIDLDSYEALQDYDLLSKKITNFMLEGVSTRSYENLLEEVQDGVGLKKSTVSKAFKKGTQKMLEELNNRSLKEFTFIAIMIDSIELGGRAVLTALGITEKGKKLILGIREGTTESSEVVKDLFHNLTDRGLNIKNPILFVTDGAKALKKGILKLFGRDALIQRCIRHKERNIISYLPESYHLEFRRRWKKLHSMSTFDEAEKEYKSLVQYLGEINYEALNSLEEANMETLTVIRLGTPKLLRKTLLSTNPIESPFDFVRSKSNRVKNWNVGTKQICRWTASLLLQAEKRFHSVEGFREIPILTTNMKNLLLQTTLVVA